jgi:hypothetical protein
MTDSPIFTKTYDLMVWLVPVLSTFPKEQRFRLAARIDDSLFAFHRLILQAARARQRRPLLLEADLELERLRVYLRLAQDVKSLVTAQPAVIASVFCEAISAPVSKHCHL